MSHRIPALVLAFAAGLPALSAGAQDPPPAPAPPDRDGKEEIVRLEAWPEIPKELAGQVKIDVQRLRKAATEEMGAQARAALLAVGTPVAPGLIEALAKEKDEKACARLLGVLDLVTDARCTRLLAAEFANRAQIVRTWALYRVAAFPDAGTAAAAEAALAAAMKAKNPEKAEREEQLGAALAVTAAGSLAGLEHLIERAPKVWGERGETMRAALEAIRGEAATELVLKGLAGDRTEKIAALNLLAGCGTRASAARVKPMLDDNDNSIRIAAINALRGIVDGEPPLDKLPVFKAIEVANEWKRRV